MASANNSQKLSGKEKGQKSLRLTPTFPFLPSWVARTSDDDFALRCVWSTSESKAIYETLHDLTVRYELDSNLGKAILRRNDPDKTDDWLEQELFKGWYN